MGNAAMCKVCGSDKGLRTAGSLSNLDQNALPDYYCVEHFPVQPPLTLVRAHTWQVQQATGAPLNCSFFRRCLQIRRFWFTFLKQELWSRCQLSLLNPQLFLFWALFCWQDCHWKAAQLACSWYIFLFAMKGCVIWLIVLTSESILTGVFQ